MAGRYCYVCEGYGPLNGSSRVKIDGKMRSVESGCKRRALEVMATTGSDEITRDQVLAVIRAERKAAKAAKAAAAEPVIVTEPTDPWAAFWAEKSDELAEMEAAHAAR